MEDPVLERRFREIFDDMTGSSLLDFKENRKGFKKCSQCRMQICSEILKIRENGDRQYLRLLDQVSEKNAINSGNLSLLFRV